MDAHSYVRGFTPPGIIVLQQETEEAADLQSVIGGTAPEAA